MPDDYTGPVDEILVQGPKIYRECRMEEAYKVERGGLVSYYPEADVAGPATHLGGIVVGCADRVKADTVLAKTGAFRLHNASGSRAVTVFDINKPCCVVTDRIVGNDDGISPIAGKVLYLDGDFVVVFVGLEAGREIKS